MEYWDENDSDVDNDFSQDKCSDEPLTPNPGHESQEDGLNQDERSVIWWVVVFTCVFETLHSVSSRAMAWLLHLLGSLFCFLSQYSKNIANIAHAFPSTLHQRSQYINEKLSLPSLRRYVVCQACLSLNAYDDCLERRGSRVLVKSCPQCQRESKIVPLLKQVVTGTGNKKYYPYLVYPYVSLISSLQCLLLRPDFYNHCEEWRQRPKESQLSLSDVYDGKLWEEFMQVDSRAFLMAKNSIAFMLNIDWFQPYKHRVYSIGVIYLAIMNLPRAIRFKRENIIIIGLLPGPKEPSKTINTYLTPLVSELLLLWEGVSLRTCNAGDQLFRCALICIGCDLPAGRKTCGFLSYTANLGCSRCYCNFGTGVFGKRDYSRENGTLRSNRKHREDVKTTLACSSKSAREHKESELGCRYSCLLRLPYFDPVRMLIIDPMHNLYMGTAKYIFNSVWVKRNIIDTNGIKKINYKITSWVISPEVRFARLPACMEHSSSFTAEQWMIWVNYYSLNCLYGIIPSDHLEVWRHFVLASRLLCKRQLSKDEIKVADALLLRFCSRFQTLYGPQTVTPNIHFHSHLSACIEDFGPMSTFWLFSFERFNGILGDEPTNNRSIELQLLTRFVKDNAHLQLLSSIPSGSIEMSDILSRAVIGHAFNFTSTRHLDTTSSTAPSKADFLPATKYTISSFSSSDMDILSDAYRILYPAVLSQCHSSSLPQSYRKMLTVTIKGQKIKSGQFVYARCIAPFPCASSSLVNIRTVFTDPDVRPAKVHYFFVHTTQVNSSEFVSHSFAYVSWPMRHPSQSSIGKPYEVWCSSLNEYDTANCIIPTNNIVSLLLTAQQKYEDENVLVTIPLVL